MTGSVVFIGPSIAAAEARRIADFDYRPPAAQGDVYRAVASGAVAIGLIDGYFEGQPAVWHKEILFALASGVHVFGASSMGALRAAELAIHGMRGVGRIYEWYASGVIDADDEVALAHGPAELGYVALSLPLVNVRATLEKATLAGVMDADLAVGLLAAAKSVNFKQRDWIAVTQRAGLPQDDAARHLRWVAENAVDQKRLDAEMLIESLAALVADWPGPHRADFAFEPTDAWNAAVAASPPASSLSRADQLVLNEARVGLAEFPGLLAAAAATAASAQTEGSAYRRARDVDCFRIEHQLLDARDFREWLSANRLDERGLGEHLAARAAALDLAGRSPERLAAALLSEIKLGGRYPELLALAQTKARRLEAMNDGTTAAADISNRLLIEWFYGVRLRRPVPDDVDGARKALAFADMADFREMMLREYFTAGPKATD